MTAPTSSFLIGQLTGFVKRVSATAPGQAQMEEARLLFEAGVAWQAAQVATDEDIARLKKALDANVSSLGNTADFIRTDVAFHYELNVITRNPVFAAVYDILVEWLLDQRTITIHMPDADRLSVRDHTSIYEAVAAHDPMRAFHEMGSHLRLISQLYHESKRLSEEILRDIARDVAERMDREKQNIWSGSLGGGGANRARPSAAGRPSRRGSAKPQPRDGDNRVNSRTAIKPVDIRGPDVHRCRAAIDNGDCRLGSDACIRSEGGVPMPCSPVVARSLAKRAPETSAARRKSPHDPGRRHRPEERRRRVSAASRRPYVTKTFPGVRAVDDVSLEVSRGEVTR